MRDASSRAIWRAIPLPGLRRHEAGGFKRDANVKGRRLEPRGRGLEAQTGHAVRHADVAILAAVQNYEIGFDGHNVEAWSWKQHEAGARSPAPARPAPDRSSAELAGFVLGDVAVVAVRLVLGVAEADQAQVAELNRADH